MTDEVRDTRLSLIAWIERRSRRQVAALVVVASVLLLWFVLRSAARLLLDRWWFESTGSTDVWDQRIAAQFFLIAATLVSGVVVLGVSIVLVRRAAHRADTDVNRVVRWYAARFGPARIWILVGIAALVLWSAVTAAPRYWQSVVLFLNSRSLGETVSVSGVDLGDYLFRLPLETVVLDFLRALLLTALGISIFGHVMSGALRLPRSVRSDRIATGHLAVLSIVLLLVEIIRLVVIVRPSVVLGRSGQFVGAGFVARTVTLPYVWIAAGVMVATIATFLVGIVRRDWRPASVGLGVLGVVVVCGSMIAPAAVQAVLVSPSPAQREMGLIESNLEATRHAYSLDAIEAGSVVLDPVASRPANTAEREAIERTILFDPATMASALQALSGTPGTRISSVDLIRLPAEDGGGTRPYLIAARQPDIRDLPASGWAQEHLVYTHGDGVVLAPADRVGVDGRPFVVAPSDRLSHERATYFGADLGDWWVIVDTEREQKGGVSIDGIEGIRLDSPVRRLASAIALGDAQIALSSDLLPRSRLLIRRDVLDRLRATAPFLAWDSDPYPTVVAGRIVWIVDGYTTSSTYPFAEYVPGVGLRPSSDLATVGLNYVRHAVRATIDATTGETNLYRVTDDDADPMLAAWQRAFPRLFRPAATLPDGIRAQIRAPQDLFTVQAEMLGRYHVDSPELLFNGEQRWTRSPGAAAAASPTAVASTASLLMYVVQDDRAVWSTVQTFNPGSSDNPSSLRNELVGMLIADNSEPSRMVMVTMRSADGSALPSPQWAQNAFNGDPEVTKQVTLLNANGSEVQYGPMAPLLIARSMNWIRPILVAGSGTNSSPRLVSAATLAGGNVGEGPTAATSFDAAVTSR